MKQSNTANSNPSTNNLQISLDTKSSSYKRRGRLHQKVRKLRYLQNLKLVKRSSWTQKLISLLLIICFCSTTIFATPDSSRSLILSVGELHQDIRFGLAANNINSSIFSSITSTVFGFFFKSNGNKQQRVERIVILPNNPNGNLVIAQGDRVSFSAVGLGRDDQPISGLQFNWRIQDMGRKLAPRVLPNGVFIANSPGTFLITTETFGIQTQITVNVNANTGFSLQKILQKKDEVRSDGEKQQIKSLRDRGIIYSRDISTKKVYSAEEEERLIQQNERKNNDIKTRQLEKVQQRQQLVQNTMRPGGPSIEGEEENEIPFEVNDEAAAEPVVMRRPYDEDGWDHTNWWTADDPINRIGNPPGVSPDSVSGNGNFQLSIPLIRLPGRGIDLNLSLIYNSRLWSKSNNIMSYDADKGFPSPGWSFGFGKMVFMGGTGGCMLADADGTRHSYDGTVTSYSSGYYSYYYFDGKTTDGTFINYGCFRNSGLGFNTFSGNAILPNGTRITYTSAGAVETQAFPTQIIDPQGNYINITYVNNQGPNIQTITDTMGRVITFNYDSSNRLISITAPNLGGGTRTIARLNYRQLNLSYGFAGGITADTPTDTPYVLNAIYYPGSNTGYWFGDNDSYSSYGMIAKVLEMRGMSWSGSQGDQGTVTMGTMSKQAVYNYPMSPDYSLTDAPAYTTLTESWAGMDTSPAVTTFEVYQNASPRTVTVTQPNGLKSKQYSYNASGQWNDGLIYLDETRDGSNNLLSSSEVTWQQGDYDSPRPQRLVVTDERGQKKTTDLEYGTNFNQLIKKKEYDYNNGANPGALLRDTRTEYENHTAYINPTKHIFNLVKANEIYDGTGNRVSRTVYEYDNNILARLYPKLIFENSSQDK